jgi:D-sedoheptulose 7-phosphate isomerase
VRASPEDDVAAYLHRSAAALASVADDPEFRAIVIRIAEAITRSLRAGGKLLIAGNGGSAGDAQHLAGEFLSRFMSDRRPLPAIALTTDTSVLTAIGNDYGFEHVFERQVRGLGRPGDVLLAISTSGRSKNVVAALEAAREIGAARIGFVGSRANPMQSLCDICLIAPSDETPVVQQVHLVAGHAICGLVERAMFGAGSSP